jgi:arsenate reductase-like glutaredoxin family protein
MLLRRHIRAVNVAVKQAATPAQKNEIDDFAQHTDAPVEETTAYTRTTISRLNVAELKELATKEGLDDVEKKSGSELKRELIEHFDL